MGMRVGGGRQPLAELDILCLSEAQGYPLPFFGVVFMLTQPPPTARGDNCSSCWLVLGQAHGL